MRKFRVEINGKIHEVKIEEIKEEMEVQIAVIAAAISAYLESEEVKVIPKAPLIISKWNLAGRRDLMAPFARYGKMLKAASSWSLAGRQELMQGISNEEI
ncbi:MAG: hypothetical protein QXJ68_07210 [Methanocellales archaeon]